MQLPLFAVLAPASEETPGFTASVALDEPVGVAASPFQAFFDAELPNAAVRSIGAPQQDTLIKEVFRTDRISLEIGANMEPIAAVMAVAPSGTAQPSEVVSTAEADSGLELSLEPESTSFGAPVADETNAPTLIAPVLEGTFPKNVTPTEPDLNVESDRPIGMPTGAASDQGQRAVPHAGLLVDQPSSAPLAEDDAIVIGPLRPGEGKAVLAETDRYARPTGEQPAPRGPVSHSALATPFTIGAAGHLLHSAGASAAQKQVSIERPNPVAVNLEAGQAERHGVASLKATNTAVEQPENARLLPVSARRNGPMSSPNGMIAAPGRAALQSEPDAEFRQTTPEHRQTRPVIPDWNTQPLPDPDQPQADQSAQNGRVSERVAVTTKTTLHMSQGADASMQAEGVRAPGPSAETAAAALDLAEGDRPLSELPLVEPRAASGTSQTTLTSAPMQRPDLARGVAVQVAEVISQAQDGKIELKLYPEELGRVSMTLSQDGASLSVLLTAERGETLDLMRRHIDLLGGELRRLGYGSVEFSFNGSGPGAGGSQTSAPASRLSDAAPDNGMTDDVLALPLVTAPALAGPGRVDIRL